jgi:peptide/nickel transport system permease protein
VLGLGLVTLGVGIGIGYAWRGPDPAVSARTGALTALFVAAMIFVDKVLSVWPAYVNANAIGGRPVPTIGDSTPNLGGNFWVQTLDNFMHLLLPTVALVLIGFAAYTRYSRATMLEVLSQDYIRTARAKGLPERTVIMRHGFRNTMIPLATVVPMDLVMLLGGAIITERVFSRPGMGTLFITSLEHGDIDPVMAYLVIVGGAAIVANILADLLYAALDPRIRVNA